MPALKRHKTKYPGVYWLKGTGPNGKPEKIYYIRYRKNGKPIEEKAGRQYRDDMTAARASARRVERMQGKGLSNKAWRELKKTQEEQEKGRWTIDRLWQEYLCQKPGLKGLVTDQNRYKTYIKPVFGEKEPSDLVPLDIDRLRVKLSKQKTPGTVKNILELLRRILNFGVDRRLCKGPDFKIRMPKVNNQKTEDLTPDQLKNLLKTIDEDPHPQAGSIMKMALYTGMRRGELFRLKWKDIDFDRDFIHIRNPKGGIDQTIPLNDGARAVLEGIYRGGDEYVFPGRGGRQRTDIHHQVNKIRDKAGLPKDFRALHGLRHVYASMLASSGKVDMYTLQKLLTHKSPQMTQRYAHLRDETLKRASNLAGEIINNVMQGKTDTKVIDLKEQNE
ncbi:MAG: site-specific integrase [Deltaproteobacteria bacterium]|nr:MAG: site-specific integrase [Deltaproteobacteria bacterium]